jgi:hypothetical protein
MNKVLTAMLKGAAKNQFIFSAVVGFVAERLADFITEDGISEAEATLIEAVKGINDVSGQFLQAVK